MERRRRVGVLAAVLATAAVSVAVFLRPAGRHLLTIERTDYPIAISGNGGRLWLAGVTHDPADREGRTHPDLWLERLDECGVPALRVRVLEGPHAGSVQTLNDGRYLCIEAAPDGGVIVAGVSAGDRVLFPGGPNTIRTEGPEVERQTVSRIFVAALDLAGVPRWVSRSKGGLARPTDVVRHPDGSSTVVGDYESWALPGEQSPHLTFVLDAHGRKPTAFPHGTSTGFVARFDARGALVWTVAMGQWGRAANGRQRPNPRVAATADGGCVVVASTASEFAGDRDSPFVVRTPTCETTLSPFTPVLLRFGPTGELVWGNNAGGEHVAVLPDGRIAVAGTYLRRHQQAPFNASGDRVRRISAQDSNEDVFLAVFDDATGKPVWTRTGSGGYTDRPLHLIADDQGRLYLAGSFQRGETMFEGYSRPLRAIAGTEPFLVAYRADGAPAWAQDPESLDTPLSASMSNSAVAHDVTTTRGAVWLLVSSYGAIPSFSGLAPRTGSCVQLIAFQR